MILGVANCNRLGFVATWEDTEFEGVFPGIKADISFEPAQATAGSFSVTVDVTSADSLTALQFEVETWLAQEMGIQADSAGDGAVQAPGRTPDGRIPDGRIPDGRTPDGRTPDGHKRCRNSRLRASGYQLRYPDYRSGYRAVLAGRFQGCTKPR